MSRPGSTAPPAGGQDQEQDPDPSKKEQRGEEPSGRDVWGEWERGGIMSQLLEEEDGVEEAEGRMQVRGGSGWGMGKERGPSRERDCRGGADVTEERREGQEVEGTRASGRHETLRAGGQFWGEQWRARRGTEPEGDGRR